MSRKKIKRRTAKPRPRGQDARIVDIGSRRQAAESMRLAAKMQRQKLEEAEKEAARVRALQEAEEAAEDAIKKIIDQTNNESEKLGEEQ